MIFSLILLALIIGYFLYQNFKPRRYVKKLTQDEFIKGYRKAQLIDVREQNEYERGYIRGARNIPYSQMKQRLNELRPDKPVYLYCQNNGRSLRAADLLHKNNFEDINILSKGFKQWSGKVDTKTRQY